MEYRPSRCVSKMGRMFNVCDMCGANLDPGEKCTCKKDREKKVIFNQLYFENWKQMQLDFKEAKSD